MYVCVGQWFQKVWHVTPLTAVVSQSSVAYIREWIRSAKSYESHVNRCYDVGYNGSRWKGTSECVDDEGKNYLFKRLAVDLYFAVLGSANLCHSETLKFA